MSLTLNKNIFEKYKSNHNIFIETGTYKGGSIDLALNVGFEKIYSIDISTKFKTELHEKYNEEILNSKLELLYGESYLILDELLKKVDQPCLIWLDAHFDLHSDVCGKYICPILYELESIKNSKFNNHTILIDDLRIFKKQIEWGCGIHIDNIEKFLLEINPNYSFSYENGWDVNDILIAKLLI
jgi:hypothetical protein